MDQEIRHTLQFLHLDFGLHVVLDVVLDVERGYAPRCARAASWGARLALPRSPHMPPRREHLRHLPGLKLNLQGPRSLRAVETAATSLWHKQGDRERAGARARVPFSIPPSPLEPCTSPTFPLHLAAGKTIKGADGRPRDES